MKADHKHIPATMSIFTESTNDACMSSAYDIGFEQSDMDTSSSDHSLDEDAPKDYWFGRKYFECVLAQTMLQTSRLYESMAQIDSRLEKEIQKFPYAQTVTELRADGLEPLLRDVDADLEHDAYRAMMVCIGVIVRKGDRRQKAVLLTILRRQRAVPEGSDPAKPLNDNARNEETVTKHSRNVLQFIDDLDAASSDLGDYATALKENSDKHGLVPVYKIKELSRVPPRFLAAVTIDRFSYEGVAKNKKQARHEAARKACLEMNIEA